MRSTELFRSCANEHVAAAAMACIGGALEKRVSFEARRAGLSSGAFVARLVADYDRKADPKRRKSLEQGMVRNQMPILAGLRHVVHVALKAEWEVRPAKSDAMGKESDDGQMNWPRGCSPRNEEVLKGLYS